MPATFGAALRLVYVLCALVLAGFARPSAADNLTDFEAAVAQAVAQCRAAQNVLEVSGPDETAVEVQRFREVWQTIVTRFGGQRPQKFDEQSFATLLVDIDVRTVGALIIIGAGRQDAARDALAGIEATLAALIEPPVPSAAPSIPAR